MAPSVADTARIFEDPEPQSSPRKSHKRVPSVGEVLRGRRKENASPTKTKHQFGLPDRASPSPLGERHINSPPQPKKIPLKDEADSRPPMHKKTGSSTSLKGFIMGREKSNDGYTSNAENRSPDKLEKKRSSTNLVSLLKKKSKKDLQNESKESGLPPSPTKMHTPIWAQYATQPVENNDGSQQFPRSYNRSSDEAERLNKTLFADQSPISDNFASCPPTPMEDDFRAPQRPYLEHRNSRSSIFTENLDEESCRPPPDEICQTKGNDKSSARPESERQNSGQSMKSNISDDSPMKPNAKSKQSSRMMNIMSTFNMKNRFDKFEQSAADDNPLTPQDLDSALENVLGRYDIPQNLRDHMRNLKPEVKAGLVKGERIGSGSSIDEIRPRGRTEENERPNSKDSDSKRSRSRSRPRSRVFSISKKSKDGSGVKQEPSSRSRSKSRPKSVDLGTRPLSGTFSSSSNPVPSHGAPDSTNTPGDFIHYLREVQKPELVEVGKMHKLRILLRNESVQWTDSFVKKGGMDEIVQLLYRIMKIEWREEHEDNLLHETLLCLKALSTTYLAMQRLESIQFELFPPLLKMLFDPERKGPAEFNTRAVIISLMFSHLSATLHASPEEHEKRARTVLDLMRDPIPEAEKQTLDFVSQMHTARPYRVWCREVTNVTKEVFWIFLHHMTVVPIIEPNGNDQTSFAQTYFPTSRAPHPAAPYVGGVEWEATQYLATHLDLLNGLIVSMPTLEERNNLREDLRQSGFEKVMGQCLRTCKEKFYAGVHDGLRAWISAARTDGWPIEDVRAGPPREEYSPRKSPAKKSNVGAPPQLDLKVEIQPAYKKDDGWL